MRNQTIAVVYGGFSSEMEISIKSGKSVAKWLRDAGRTVYEVLLTRQGWWAMVSPDDGRQRYPMDLNDFSFTCNGEKIRFDNVYIAIHGDPGENGKLQAYFEMIGVRYCGCSSFSATVSFDKYSCKRYLRPFGFCLAKDILLNKGDIPDYHAITRYLGLPVFVKPSGGGSSFGVSKVRTPDELPEAISKAFEESSSVLIEEAITGREIDCAVYMTASGPKALPLIEIIPRNDFFDYEAKYMGASSELCPAPIPNDDRIMLQAEAVKIYDRLGCNGLVRMDFILGIDGRPYFLEVNPSPGMTSASLVPQMVREAGMKMEDFLTGIMDLTA